MTESSLAARLDSFAEAWRPTPGDKLIGPVVDLDQRISAYSDDPYPIVVVMADEGSTEQGKPIEPGAERAFHGFHTIAMNELAKQRPQVSERIGIAYHGRPEGKSYELYRVIVDREQTATVDWDVFGNQSEQVLVADAERAAAGIASEGGTDDIPF